jgi:hypothetical protein
MEKRKYSREEPRGVFSDQFQGRHEARGGTHHDDLSEERQTAEERKRRRMKKPLSTMIKKK